MKAKIITKDFTDEKTGEIRPYSRLALYGDIGGETHTLELKLTKAELLIVKILLSSSEDNEVTSRPSTAAERAAFLSENDDQDENWPPTD